MPSHTMPIPTRQPPTHHEPTTPTHHEPATPTHHEPTTATRRGPTPTRRGRSWVTGVCAVSAVLALTACGGGGNETAAGTPEPVGDPLPADAESILTASADTMGATTSVAFRLERDGAPVYIDEFDSISINTADGQFEVPRTAQAVLEVEVNGSLTTELAAIALEDDIWLSNPVTGDFEPLPPGIELDPSMFFDPENGWAPLMANLTNVTLHGLVERDGADRYHLTATAPAEQVEIITARLVRDVSVDIDFWLQPVNGAVMAAEFTTDFPDGAVDWTLTLTDYGADFEIEPPDGLATGSDDTSGGELTA